MRRGAARAVIAAAMTIALTANAAQPSAVPAKNRAVLMLRVLLYDRNLSKRASDSLARVVIASRPGDSDGEEMAKVLGDLSRRAVLGGRKIQVRHVAPEELPAVLEAEVTAAVYLAPGATSPALLTAVRRHRVLTFSSDDAAPTAIGFVQRADKVVITVNLEAARAEGADLDSELLALADVR